MHPDKGNAVRAAHGVVEAGAKLARDTDIQELVVASDANLRALFCSRAELAVVLTAADALHRLAPPLAVDSPVTGAVVARSLPDGSTALRRVVRVERLQLVPGGTLDPNATLLVLSPGEQRPVPLGALLDLSLDQAVPDTWAAAVRALQDAERRTAQAGGGGAENGAAAAAAAAAEATGLPGGGPFLGDRAGCAVVALRLAQLHALAAPLAKLQRHLRSAHVAVSDVIDALSRGSAGGCGGGGGGGALLLPDEREVALELVAAVVAVRCQAPDGPQLAAWLHQLQGAGEALQLWRTQQAAAAVGPALGGAAQETPVAPAPGKSVEVPRWEDCGVDFTSASAAPAPAALRPRVHDSPDPAADSGQQQEVESEDGVFGQRSPQRPCSPDAPSDDCDDEPSGPPPTIEHWVHPSKRALHRTPAGDVGFTPDSDGFPPAVTLSSWRIELAELLLALGVVYAASCVRFPKSPGWARFRPGHRFWADGWKGAPVAVDLRVLLRQLPSFVRDFVVRFEQPDWQGDEEVAANALSSFIRHQCCSLVLVHGEGRQSDRPSVALARGWLGVLKRHDLLRSLRQRLKIFVDIRLARTLQLGVADAMNFCRPLKLYAELYFFEMRFLTKTLQPGARVIRSTAENEDDASDADIALKHVNPRKGERLVRHY